MERDLSALPEMLAANQWSEARTMLEGWRELYPEDDRLLRELAMIYSQLDDHEAAAAAFLALYDRYPGETEHLLFAAQSSEAAGQLGEAIQLYRLYLASDPDNAPLWRITARLEEERGHHRQALDAYFQSYRLQPDDQVALHKGELFLTLNNLPQARQWFRTAAAEDSRVRDDALIALIEVEILLEEWNAVEEHLRTLKDRNPELYDHSGLAAVEEEIRVWRAALAEAEAIRLAEIEARRAEDEEDPVVEEPDTGTEIATAGEADEPPLRLTRDDPDDGPSIKELAMLDDEDEDPRREDEEETEPVVGEPADEEEEEQALTETTPEEEVEEEIRPLRRPAREIARELTEEGRSLADRRRNDEAIATFWSSLAHFDRDPETWYYLSRTYMQMRRFEEAEATILEARRLDPDSLAYYSHYFFVAREVRPLRLFIREVQEALDRFPNHPDLILLLAQAYTRGEYSREEAVALYRRFLRQAPTDHPARHAVENFLAGRTTEVRTPTP